MADSSTTKALAFAAGTYAAWKFLDNKYQIANDVDLLRRLFPLIKFVKEKGEAGGYTVADWWEESVAKHRTKVSVQTEGRALTFQEMDQKMNSLANWALSKGIKRGDTVSIFMENTVEFLLTYFAMAKIGVLTAWINCNLRLKGLLHCVSVANSKAIFFGPSISDAIAEVQAELAAGGIQLYAYGDGKTVIGEEISPILETFSSAPIPREIRKGLGLLDKFAYIYTSGTTGLPKAAVITNQKMMQLGGVITFGFRARPDDRIYCALPMYHSSATLGVGAMVFLGVPFMFRKKFSVTNFWKDATETKATIIQYIGEFCRYLLNQPPGPLDKAHKVRIAIGNGMRPEIWGQFQDRFNIPEIGEFYGATEGNVALINLCTEKSSRGYVGRQGWIASKFTGIKLVKFDVDKEEIIRDKNGWCIECAPGEAGELIGPIIASNSTSRFEGYTDEASTKKKILTDAFVKGDKFFRTGDLLTRDKNGYLSFVDRIGDTFRWKGENVSTTEVAEVLSVFPGIHEANVYGVQIPGKDGRACMAGIVCDDNLDFQKLFKHVSEHLPTYAVPMFLRKLKVVEITGTFKHQKGNLRKEAFDLATVTDPLYWLNPSTKQYEPFTSDSLNLITSGKAKL